MRRNAAFTLVEIMIVVSIIALLAVLALPSFLRARQQSKSAKFVNALRVATSAVESYAAENRGAYPPDTTRGVVPPTLLGYLDPTLNWRASTPIGGQWDWDFNVFGARAAVSVVNPGLTASEMTDIDATFDDGDLSTGRFRSRGDGRYSDIIEE